MALSLKNKIFLLSISIVALVLVNCSQKQEEKVTAEKTDSANCKTEAPLNPNGDSELSVLMRKMLHTSESLKDIIKRGDVPEKFPEEFLKIHTAEPTDSETKKASFNGFADIYLNNLNTLYKSPKTELTINYNAVINACVSCHTEHCPGPLKAIRKLKLE